MSELWHNYPIRCYKCDEIADITAVSFNASGEVRVESICSCGAGDSREASLAAIMRDCRMADFQDEATREPPIRPVLIQ